MILRSDGYNSHHFIYSAFIVHSPSPGSLSMFTHTGLSKYPAVCVTKLELPTWDVTEQAEAQVCALTHCTLPHGWGRE